MRWRIRTNINMQNYVRLFFFNHSKMFVRSKISPCVPGQMSLFLSHFNFSCKKKFQPSHMNSKRINIFRHDGSSIKGTMVSYSCNSSSCRITVFPNHYRTHEACISNRLAFENTSYFYYGGDCAYQKSMLNQFGLLLR